jgi:hypothetical protein
MPQSICQAKSYSSPLSHSAFRACISYEVHHAKDVMAITKIRFFHPSLRCFAIRLHLSLAAALSCALSVSDGPSANNQQSYPSIKLSETLSSQGQFRVGIETLKNVETPGL